MWRKRKKKKNFRPLIIPVLALLLFAGVFFVFYKSSFLNIKKIDVQAKDIICANADQLKASSGLSGQNFFLISPSEIENNLKKKFVCIKSVITSKTFPDKVILQTVNREALAVFASLKDKEASFSATPSAELVKDYFLVDSEGVVFGRGESNPWILTVYLFNQELSIGQKLTGGISDIPRILDKIKILGIQIDTARINQDSFIITSVNPVSEMFFRLNNNVDVQLASLQLILDKAKIDLNELEFIDLRFDRPVVRFAPKK